MRWLAGWGLWRRQDVQPDEQRGHQASGETANMSRDSILNMINTGNEGDITMKSIVDRMPGRVLFRVNGALRESSLGDWHKPANGPALKDYCINSVFRTWPGACFRRLVPA